MQVEAASFQRFGELACVVGREEHERALPADDRAELEPAGGRLLVRPAPALAGLIEVRGLGLRRLPYEPVAVVGLVVDLAAADAQRLPGPEQVYVTIEGIPLARIAVAPGEAAFARLIAALHMPESAI